MCRKIRCDGESWKLFAFCGELNKAKTCCLLFPRVLQHCNFLKEIDECSWIPTTQYHVLWVHDFTNSIHVSLPGSLFYGNDSPTWKLNRRTLLFLLWEFEFTFETV